MTELAALVELVSGFNHSEGELRTLLATARMFAAKGNSGASSVDILDTPMTPEAVRAFRRGIDEAVARHSGVGVE